MHIYLKHFLHGTKVAISDAEADYDEKNGWVRYNPITRSDSEEAAPVNTLGLKRKYIRKSTETEAITEGV